MNETKNTQISDNYFLLDPYYNYYTTEPIIQKMRMKLLELGHPMFNGDLNDYKILTNFTELRFQYSQTSIEQLFEETFHIRSEFLEFPIEFHSNKWPIEPVNYNERYRGYLVSRLNMIFQHFGFEIENSKKYQPIIEQFLITVNLKELSSSNINLIKQTIGIDNLFEYFVVSIKKQCCTDKGSLYYKESIDVFNKIYIQQSKKMAS